MRIAAATLLLILAGNVAAQDSPADLVTAAKVHYEARRYKEAKVTYEKARTAAEAAALRVREGMPLAEAVIDAGAVRFRPMMLTAAAVVVGASVILFDPIFQGLALSLMAGEVASLLLSRMAVPVLYYLLERNRHQAPVSEQPEAVRELIPIVVLERVDRAARGI